MCAEPCNLWDEYVTSKSAEIKEQLVMKYLYLVKKIAAKMAYRLPAHISRDDLYSYGVFGLLEAIERYNPQHGVEFSIFAGKRINGSIIDGMRKDDWVPLSVRKKAKHLEGIYHKLENKLGRSATDAEIAVELDINTEELAAWLASVSYVTVLSLDEPLGQEDKYQLQETLIDPHSPDPLSLAEAEEIKTLLAQALASLPEKERLVMSLFYYQDLANKEIAHILEVSESRVSQLHTKAIFRLRGKLARVKKYCS